MAAGALESTRILLNSQSPSHPHGVGNSNGVLGHYLMDHFTVEGAGGLMPSLRSSKREPVGRPCGFLIPKYVNRRRRKKIATRSSCADTVSTAMAARSFTVTPFSLPEFGDAWRERVREEIPYYFAHRSAGRVPAQRATTSCASDPSKKDAWGIPVLHINASYGENEKAMAAAMRDDIAAILDAMKLTDVLHPGRPQHLRQEHPRMRHRPHGLPTRTRAWSTATAKCTTLPMYS